MGDALAWVLLLPLLLQTPGSRGLSCNVSVEPVNWTRQFSDTCLNFSGKSLRQLPDEHLQARDLELLDLSGNSLQQLPWSFFEQLDKLTFLDVTNNLLDHMDSKLATRCDLRLQADCRCGLQGWYELRQKNCSDHLECLDRTAHTWHNLSTFHCPPGLSRKATGALAAGGSLILALAIAGPVLFWRLRGRRAPSDPVQGKAWTAHDAPQAGTRQPRYSHQGFSPKPPATTLPSPSSPDYENMFQGQPTAGHQVRAARSRHVALSPPVPSVCSHRPHTPDDDCYMNYEAREQDSQPVYCNLQTLGQAPQGRTLPDQTSLDEEEYVIPGR
ncbi:Leucine-rich repeat-containing protein 25 [Galemys pyrenaicus]|uniref:Leucine-rich repeat-containing protein 25 n=1 Tax=Galemys pyrenaicus TaxID=202257 RepID=A0A8J6AF33_GALPY|nr:Leucine-rich repeat-containing protein 25 [Galemys pyrenaicus]